MFKYGEMNGDCEIGACALCGAELQFGEQVPEDAGSGEANLWEVWHPATCLGRFAFISRHAPTPEQIALARELEINLVAVGDVDAFDQEAVRRLIGEDEFEGVICVHPALAMEALSLGLKVGVFQNTNRAAVGEPPRFETGALVTYKPAPMQANDFYHAVWRDRCIWKPA